MKFGALLQLLKFGVDSSNTVLPFNYQRKCCEYSKFGVRCFKSVLEFVTGWKFLIIRSLITHSWMEHSSEPGQGQYDQDGVGCEGLESGGCSFSRDKFQMVTARNEGEIDKKKLLTERLFMRRCSASSMESLVRSAMTVKGMVLSSAACALWCYVSIISDRADEKTEKENRKGDKKQFLTRTQIEEEEFPTSKILFTKKPSLPKNSYSLTINLA
ncbi:unnamed protein product [Brassica napus]|uniref:(rape) hypothetical protein n=1 Tax=Brassica napus TaxID=3708 RepID=A0A816JST0_BRANA|nr:unnamed protein product [Brassica napus]